MVVMMPRLAPSWISISVESFKINFSINIFLSFFLRNDDFTAKYNDLNSAFAKSNMDVIWINQEGTYTFPLPIGKMAVVITYHGIYPHYSGSGGITANQLGGDEENENVVTSVNNNQHTVSVYNKESGATQAIILVPR